MAKVPGGLAELNEGQIQSSCSGQAGGRYCIRQITSFGGGQLSVQRDLQRGHSQAHDAAQDFRCDEMRPLSDVTRAADTAHSGRL